jgi:DNA ligase (NAD+)
MVVRIEGEVAHRCVNPECAAQRKRALEHFASRNAMAIDHLGEAVVEQLVDRSLVKTVADLYSLELKELLSLGGFAERSAMNLFNSIQESKKNDLWRLVHGLGIPQVGETVSQLLSREFESMDAFSRASREKLMEISGIGASMADSVVRFFENPERQKMLLKLKHQGVNMLSLLPQKAVGGPLSGQKFVLTGELKNHTRSQAKAQIEALGGKVVDKVTKNVAALVAGESPGGKLAEARKLGVGILDETGFEKLLAGS